MDDYYGDNKKKKFLDFMIGFSMSLISTVLMYFLLYYFLFSNLGKDLLGGVGVAFILVMLVAVYLWVGSLFMILRSFFKNRNFVKTGVFFLFFAICFIWFLWFAVGVITSLF